MFSEIALDRSLDGIFLGSQNSPEGNKYFVQGPEKNGKQSLNILFSLLGQIEWKIEKELFAMCIMKKTKCRVDLSELSNTIF